MELSMEVRQSGQRFAGSLEPSHLWILGLPATEERPSARPQARPYSFAAECECPDDCLRDHDNE